MYIIQNRTLLPVWLSSNYFIHVCLYTKITTYYFSCLSLIFTLLWFTTHHTLVLFPTLALCLYFPVWCVLNPQWHFLPPPSCRLLLSFLSQASWLEFRRPVSGFELHCCADPLKLSNSAPSFCLIPRGQKRKKMYICFMAPCWHQ